MAQDATGTPTAKGIPKYNTAADAPSGKGFNAAMEVIDGLIPTDPISDTIVNAKGDLIVATAADTVTRLAVGSNNQLLTADSAQSEGVKWADAPAGAIAPTHINMNYPDKTSGSYTANTAYLVPIQHVHITGSYTRVFWSVQTSAGNFDFGLYHSDDESTFTRVSSTGSTAVPGTGARTQAVTFTITPVTGRRWYFAFAFSSTGNASSYTHIGGGYNKASSFPLPSSLTSMTAHTGDAINVMIAV